MFGKVLNKVGDFFSLDIGTTSIRGVQLKGSKKNLLRYHRSPIAGNLIHSDSDADKAALVAAIKEFVKAGNFEGKNVVAGVSSNDLFTAVVDIPKLDDKELKKSIKYQIEQYIPIPLEEAKVDWHVLGDSPESPQKSELLIASISRGIIEQRLEVLEAAGLNVLAFEPDGVALTRALMNQETDDANLILDFGYQGTDLVITYKKTPKLIRTIAGGSKAFINATKNELGVDEKQAEQFVYKFGLSQSKLEGQVRKALLPTVDSIIDEVKKSITFFGSRYNGVKIERVIITGIASTVPELPLQVANRTGIQVEIGNAWVNTTYPSTVHNELMAVSSSFAVASGLALREEL